MSAAIVLWSLKMLVDSDCGGGVWMIGVGTGAVVRVGSVSGGGGIVIVGDSSSCCDTVTAAVCDVGIKFSNHAIRFEMAFSESVTAVCMKEGVSLDDWAKEKLGMARRLEVRRMNAIMPTPPPARISWLYYGILLVF